MTFRCTSRLWLGNGRLLLASALLCASARAADAQDDLKRLSIEELLRIDVTTTTRRPQPIGTTAAAISVITGDDIRRAGVTTIADALLLADGVHVARFNNGTRAISTPTRRTSCS